MKKEKKYLIYGIGMILITIVGVSVAYFTVNMTGANANVNVTTAKLGSISFTAEGVSTDNTKILPGWTSGDKTVVVTLTESDYDVEYTCTLNITSNNITDLTLLVAGDNALSSANKKIGTTTTEIEISSGKISSGESKTMTYNLTFPETGTNQDTQQNKTVIATVSCKTSGSTVYYNAENPGGTTIEPSVPISLTAAILRDNGTILTRSDFSVPFTTTNTGTFYQATETVGSETKTIYYFAGDAKNNWVKFGKQVEGSCTYNGVEVDYVDLNSSRPVFGVTASSESECHSTNVCDVTATMGFYAVGVDEAHCTNAGGTYLTEQATWNVISVKDIYWRIIRTNADGSVRLLYSGTSPDTTEGYIGTSAYNTNEDDPMYVGYMYGTSGSLESNRTNENSSTIKTYIDNWYQSNLLTNYDKYISREAVYCNDRSITNGTYSTSSSFYYAPYTRLITNETPTYNCSDINDMFTTSDSTVGNKKLTYPIALMTADEVTFAGGKVYTALESPYAWYYTNAKGESITGTNGWWTMSPDNWYGSYSYVGSVNDTDSLGSPGRLDDGFVGYSDAVRPSVSLKSCNLISKGDGRASNPYEIYYGEGGC